MSAAVEYGKRIHGDQRADSAFKGIGLAIVKPDGRIWVQQDVGKRTETGRKKAHNAIPFETQKVGEPHMANVLGSLHEVFDDKTLSPVAGHLYTTDGYRSTPTRVFHGGVTPIEYSLAVAIFDGPDDLFRPGPTAEALPVGWMTPDELLGLQDVRPLARHAVEYLQEEDIIAEK